MVLWARPKVEEWKKIGGSYLKTPKYRTGLFFVSLRLNALLRLAQYPGYLTMEICVPCAWPMKQEVAPHAPSPSGLEDACVLAEILRPPTLPKVEAGRGVAVLLRSG